MIANFDAFIAGVALETDAELLFCQIVVKCLIYVFIRTMYFVNLTNVSS